jgi:hypothetical protein
VPISAVEKTFAVVSNWEMRDDMFAVASHYERFFILMDTVDRVVPSDSEECIETNITMQTSGFLKGGGFPGPERHRSCRLALLNQRGLNLWKSAKHFM